MDDATATRLMYETAPSLTLALILGLGIGLSYLYFYKGFFHSRSFVHTVILTTVLCAIIAQVIGPKVENSGLAFAMVGMLGLIRFRTVVRDTREFSYIFLAIVIGVATGSGHWPLAIAGAALAITLMLVLERAKIGEPKATPVRLKLTLGESLATAVVKKLDAHCEKFELISTKAKAPDSLEMYFDAVLRRDSSMAGFVSKLRAEFEHAEISVHKWTRTTAEKDSNS